MLIKLLLVILATINFNVSNINLNNVESVNVTEYGVMINYTDDTGYYIDFVENK